ncbi:signal peptide containing with threonine stretches [Cryptosporidium sp. chipmunk genotype I]|uniref:signal peptide containing with threonine stretches n=1 Tax=Cryptosporidium sp. chipmunk genotype I TaxID=1280935 RepID=UPI00351A3E31|nr:signal peptide containing with threonine stretches [Cryptosporidium sp. chipmunk genotype I]
MYSFKQIIVFVCVVGLTLINGIESKGYRESRVNKVIKIETRSKSSAISDSDNTCGVNTMNISNFMNTSRWRRIRNKLGTGWDDNLIPPLIFCVKILDKPTNTSNSCNRNTFDLILNDGINKNKNSVVIATVDNVLKGEEKCMFISPCEILRRIYWNDNNFTNSINGLEFKVSATFESSAPNQRFISVISIKGLARSLKKAKNPWDNHLKMVQRFKNVQALSLFIPYKPHSKSFISDTCIVKPKVTSIFYGKNKPSVCKFNNCMWNIWIGQLSGEFVNERCTIGKASSRGDYIVGWFSPYAIDSETLGSVKLKIQWNSPEDHNESTCSVTTETEKKIVDYDKESQLRGSLRSDWFPGTEDHKYETIYGFDPENTNSNIRSTEIKLDNLVESHSSSSTSTTTSSATTISTTTTTTTITTTTTTTNTTTTTTTNTITTKKPIFVSTTTTLKPKLSVVGSGHDSNNMSVCVNGRCGNAKNLWLSCHSNTTRHLAENGEAHTSSGSKDDIQIEWIDLDNETKIFEDSKGNLYYNMDGYVDNKETNSTELSNQESKSQEVINDKNTCEEDHICACMMEGLVEEDITVIDRDDDDDSNDGVNDPINNKVDNETQSTEFEKIENKYDRKVLFEKWQNLKKIYES